MKTLYIRTTPLDESTELFSCVSEQLTAAPNFDEDTFFLVNDDSIAPTATNKVASLLAMVEHYLYKYEALFNYRIDHILLITKETITEQDIAAYLPVNGLTTTIDAHPRTTEGTVEKVLQTLPMHTH